MPSRALIIDAKISPDNLTRPSALSTRLTAPTFPRIALSFASNDSTAIPRGGAVSSHNAGADRLSVSSKPLIVP